GLRIEKSSFTVSKLRFFDLARLEKSNFKKPPHLSLELFGSAVFEINSSDGSKGGLCHNSSRLFFIS
ncbi:MAG: hypothetical protein RR551_06125, partial [Mucinivorans sp.]